MPIPEDPPKCRYLIYSYPGVGKSTLLAKFRKRLLVFCFDPYLKDSPYLDKGYSDLPQLMEDGTPFRDITDADGKLLIRLIYLHDENPEKPTAYKRFQKLMAGMTPAERSNWATIGVDSVSNMAKACLYMQQFDINKDYKDPRKWYADVTDHIERMLMRFASWTDVDLVLLCHISSKTDEAAGGIVRQVKLPGRLGNDGPDGFPEVYRLFVLPDGQRALQTQRQADSWLCMSQFLNAPNPCAASYAALWANYQDRSRPRPVNVEGDAVEATAIESDVQEVAANG